MNSNFDSTAISCKVVLIGQSGVGKTSIINRYVKNTFSSDCPPTPGVSFVSKVMNFTEHDKVIKFDIWDTAGQEKYRSLAKIYYKSCNVAILVYDITRKSSFEELRTLWYPLLKENITNNKLVVVIAANKYDMYEIEEVEEDKVKTFAKEIGAIFKYTSAKNSNGIDDLFETIGEAIIHIAKNSPKGLDELNVRDSMIEKSIIIDKKRQSTVKKKGCCKY